MIHQDRRTSGDSPARASARDEAGYLRETWARLGLPGAIDIHTHFMPAQVMDKVWSYFDRAGPLTGSPWPITYRLSEDERVDRLREFGILAFTSLIYPHRPAMAEWLNAWALDFADTVPECIPTATFFPEPGAVEYVNAAISRGARIFKAHVQVGDYDPNDPMLDQVWGVLTDTGVPVIIHCGSGPAPGRFTGPDPIRTLTRRHPRIALVIAHMGLPEYDQFLDLAASHDRVHLDTTMAFTDFTERTAPFPVAQLPRLRDLGDRVLFGSDYPNIPYQYRHAVTSLEALDMGDDWLRLVMHDNARRLIDG